VPPETVGQEAVQQHHARQRRQCADAEAEHPQARKQRVPDRRGRDEGHPDHAARRQAHDGADKNTGDETTASGQAGSRRHASQQRPEPICQPAFDPRAPASQQQDSVEHHDPAEYEGERPPPAPRLFESLPEGAGEQPQQHVGPQPSEVVGDGIGAERSTLRESAGEPQ